MSTKAATTDGQEQDSPRYLTWVLVVLSLIGFFNYMDRFVISVLVEPIKASLGFSDSQMGLLTGFAFAAFYATFGLPLARLADSKSRIALLSVAMAAWSIMTAACGLAQNFVQMLLARIGVGVGEAGCVPASHSLLGDYYPPEKRAFALGVFQAGGGLGTMAGLVLGGLIAEAFGWRAAFMIVGLPGVLVAVLAWMTVREPPRGRYDPGTTHEPVSTRAAFKTLLGRRTFRQIVIAYSLGLIGVYGFAQWIPAFMMRSHEMTLGEVGIWVGLASGAGSFIGIGLGAILAPKVIERDRRWEVWWPGAAYGLCVPVYLLTFGVGDTTLALALAFVASLIAGSGIGPGMASVQTVAEPRLRATAIAFVMFMSAVIGQGGGPFLIGLMSDLLTPQYGIDSLRVALMLTNVLLAWCVIHFWLAGRTMLDEAVN